MKVFISWSGELSHKVAQEFRDWLPNVIQQLEPFLSSGDIGAGADWNNILRQQLDQTLYGIICLTKDNWEKPWINFEAGSLSKSVEKARCMTFLIDIMQKDITGPLAQFNHTKFDKNEVKKMLVGLNEACEPSLTELKLTTAFDKWWPELEEKLKTMVKEAEKTPKKKEKTRSVEEVLEELVEQVRAQSNAISKIQSFPRLLVNDLTYDQIFPKNVRRRMTGSYYNPELMTNLSSISSYLSKLRAILKNYNDDPPFDAIKDTIDRVLDLNTQIMNIINPKKSEKDQAVENLRSLIS